MRRLAPQAEALCRAVAPDVAGGPVYAVLHADLPADLRTADGPAGMTTRHLDLILRPTLEKLGRWRGRGPTMAVDPAAVASALACRTRTARRWHFAPTFLGIVLHELAHILDAGLIGGPEPPASLVTFAALALKAELDGVTAPTNGPAATIPWRRHEAPFIRIVLHLAHRARVCGAWLFAEDLFDAVEYSLSPTRRYAAALGDEPGRLAGCAFANIRATPQPAA